MKQQKCFHPTFPSTEGQQLVQGGCEGRIWLKRLKIGVDELAREIFNNRFMKIISIWKSASHDETTKRPSHAGGKPMSFDRSFSSRFPSEELVWIAPLWDLSRETSLRKSSRIIGKYSFWLNSTWRFPKIGVPLVIIHFRLGFSITNQPAIGVPPWLWKPYLKLLFSSWISHSFPICSQGFLGDCHVTSPLESGSRHLKRWKLILEVCRRKSTDITRANGRPDGRLTNHLCCIYIYYIYVFVYLFIYICIYIWYSIYPHIYSQSKPVVFCVTKVSVLKHACVQGVRQSERMHPVTLIKTFVESSYPEWIYKRALLVVGFNLVGGLEHLLFSHILGF